MNRFSSERRQVPPEVQIDLPHKKPARVEQPKQVGFKQLEHSREERDSSLESWMQGFSEVQSRWGKEGGERVLGILKTRGPKTTLSEIQSELGEIPERKELQDHAFALLEQEGILSHGTQGELILDVPAFTQLDFHSLRGKLGARKGRRFEQYHKGSSRKFWYEVFRDEPVISKQEYAEGVREAKPLFYMPETETDAFDIEAIRESDFYLGLWDVRGKNLESEQGEALYPSSYDSLDYYATELACKIYHPKYGAGYRNEQNQLMVADQKGKYAPISAEGMAERFGWFGPTAKYESGAVGTAVYRPIEYLQTQGRKLLEHDLVKVTDFHMQHGATTEKQYRLVKSGVRSNGEVMINRVRYPLGRRFKNQPIKIYKISPSLAGIVRYDGEGKETLEYTFTLLSPDDTRLRPTKQMVGGKEYTYYGAPKEHIALAAYSKETLSEQQEGETDKEYQKRLQSADNFERLLAFSHIFSQEAGVNIAHLQFGEQAWAVAALDALYQKSPREVIDFVRIYREDGLRALLSAEQGGLQMGEQIFGIGRRLKPLEAMKIFSAFNELADIAVQEAYQALEMLQAAFSEEAYSLPQLQEATMKRGKDMLQELYHALDDRDATKADLVLDQFIHESALQKAGRGKFKQIVELLSAKESIDLREFEKAQTFVASVGSHEPDTAYATFLRALHVGGHIKPIPEIHWRVDRSLPEYERRLGINIPGLLGHLAPSKGKNVLLEFGPGSGMSKRERSMSALAKHYNDYAMADTLYYPIAGVIEKMIDFDTLEKAIGGGLTKDDRAAIADIIYKTIVIQEGQTADDTFSYDAKHIQAITEDPNTLKRILHTIGPRLARVEKVPTTISTRDTQGNVVYSYKVERVQQSRTVQMALEKFSEWSTQYLRKDLDEVDAYTLINAFPPGILIGDFAEVRRLKDNQVDVALGIRSTVYKYKQDYVDFMVTFADKLKDGGIYIDDNVRDNDGWYYRIAELLKVQQQLQGKRTRGEIDYTLDIQIVLGTGFPGEDHEQEGEVPLAVVVGKNVSHAQTVAPYIQSGFRLVSLDEYAGDQEALQRLDATNHVAASVKEVLGGGRREVEDDEEVPLRRAA